MESPFVSVIIPVYNTEKYIGKTLESVCAQTLANIEILVVNDGSTDQSLKVIEQFMQADQRIQLFQQSNRGLSVARNTGLQNARGEYIYFMDSDDLLEPCTLELCYQKCLNEQLDFIFFDAESFSDEPIPLRNYQYKRNLQPEDKVWTGPEMLALQYATWSYRSSACLSFTRHSFLKQNDIDFYPELIHEDELYTPLLYLNAKRIYYLPQPFFKRRIRSQSITTRTFGLKNIMGYFTVTDQLSLYSHRHPQQAEIIHKHLSRMLNAATLQAFRLPLKERLHLFKRCLSEYSSFVSTKTLGILLFKTYFKK